MAAARFELDTPARDTVPRARAATGPVTWRLLSGNNRDLGHAARVFADAAACLAEVDRLRLALLRATVSVSSSDGRARWIWRVAVDAVDAAVASRVYQRRVQAEAACAVFLNLAGAASVAGVVRVAGTGRSGHR